MFTDVKSTAFFSGRSCEAGSDDNNSAPLSIWIVFYSCRFSHEFLKVQYVKFLRKPNI